MSGSKCCQQIFCFDNVLAWKFRCRRALLMRMRLEQSWGWVHSMHQQSLNSMASGQNSIEWHVLARTMTESDSCLWSISWVSWRWLIFPSKNARRAKRMGGLVVGLGFSAFCESASALGLIHPLPFVFSYDLCVRLQYAFMWFYSLYTHIEIEIVFWTVFGTYFCATICNMIQVPRLNILNPLQLLYALKFLEIPKNPEMQVQW